MPHQHCPRNDAVPDIEFFDSGYSDNRLDVDVIQARDPYELADPGFSVRSRLFQNRKLPIECLGRGGF